jgi:hypothetical protein
MIASMPTATLTREGIRRIVVAQGPIFGMRFSMRIDHSKQSGEAIVFLDGFIRGGTVRSRTRCLGELAMLSQMSEADVALLVAAKMTGIPPRRCARIGCKHFADTQRNAMFLSSPIGDIMVFFCATCFTAFQRSMYANH